MLDFVETTPTKVVSFAEIAFCPRSAWITQRFDATPIEDASRVAVAINKSIREAIIHNEELQREFSYIPARDEDSLLVAKTILVKPDIIFKKNDLLAIGIVAPMARFTFNAPADNSHQIMNSLAILAYAFECDAYCLGVCRDSLQVRIIGPLRPQDAADKAERLIEAYLSSTIPRVPFEVRTVFSKEEDCFKYLLPRWPCNYCKVRNYCEQLQNSPQTNGGEAK